MGEVLYVNYIKSICYYDDFIEEDNELTNNIIAHFARIFRYKTANIIFEYKNFVGFSDNYKEDKEYLYTKLYCDTIYKHYIGNVKETKKQSSNYFKYEYGFWKLDNIGKEKVPIEIINKVAKKFNESKDRLFI
jgi:hypothetical protein